MTFGRFLVVAHLSFRKSRRCHLMNNTEKILGIQRRRLHPEILIAIDLQILVDDNVSHSLLRLLLAQISSFFLWRITPFLLRSR